MLLYTGSGMMLTQGCFAWITSALQFGQCRINVDQLRVAHAKHQATLIFQFGYVAWIPSLLCSKSRFF